MRSINFGFIFAVIFGFWFACSSRMGGRMNDPKSYPPANQERSSPYSDGIILEDFDPLDLHDSEINVKNLNRPKKEPEISKTAVNSSVENAENSFLDLDNTVKFAEDSITQVMQREMVPGWRVQVCAVTDEASARQIQRLAEDIFETYADYKVYLTYDSPYYKVRIGDCTSRFEVDRLLQIVNENGFTDAWIVRTNVYKLK
ncbi:SPOR domain-containing protein [candidate division KSB1 bacterium]|nr:SPOR domain-containing protein [candidate division KSB1 bacterium]